MTYYAIYDAPKKLIVNKIQTKGWAQAGKILYFYKKKLVIVSATGIPSAITYNADDGLSSGVYSEAFVFGGINRNFVAG